LAASFVAESTSFCDTLAGLRCTRETFSAAIASACGLTVLFEGRRIDARRSRNFTRGEPAVVVREGPLSAGRFSRARQRPRGRRVGGVAAAGYLTVRHRATVR